MSNRHPPNKSDEVWASAPVGVNGEPQDLSEMSERKPTVEEIAREAYAIYVANGKQDGRDLDDWLEAERRVMANHRPGSPLQTDAVVQPADGEPRERSARPRPDRRRNTRYPVIAYMPL